MKDHPVFIQIWQFLRKKSVIVFIETPNFEKDTDKLMSWFDPIIEERLGLEDSKMKNGSFLCIRELLERMPSMNRNAYGDYEVVVLSYKHLTEVLESIK